MQEIILLHKHNV